MGVYLKLLNHIYSNILHENTNLNSDMIRKRTHAILSLTLTDFTTNWKTV